MVSQKLQRGQVVLNPVLPSHNKKLSFPNILMVVSVMGMKTNNITRVHLLNVF